MMKGQPLTKTQKIRRWKNFGNFMLNVPMLLIILVPLIYTLSISLVNPDQVYKTLLLPHTIQFGNYVNAFTNPSYNFLIYIRNSFIVSTSVMLCQMITASMAAFAFVFLDFKGKNFWFMCVLATMMIPADVVLVANYQTVSKMHLINTYRNHICLE